MPKTAFVPDDYVSVKERIEKFWEDHPDGAILTRMRDERNAEKQLTGWMCAAIVFKDKRLHDWLDISTAAEQAVAMGGVIDGISGPDATGWARQELLAAPPLKRDGSPNEFAPEWTSPVEVVETSAIGRALANMGYQTKGRPSQEEASKARAKGGDSDTSLHDDTYAYAVEQLGDAAADIFVPALGRAGITAGNWITTDAQAKQVRDEIDAATG